VKRRLIAAVAGTAALTAGVVGLSPTPASAVDAADLAGNFAGDAREEMFWYVAGSTPDLMVSLSNGGVSGGALTADYTEFAVNGTYDPIVGNFDGDAYDEILWYAPGPTRDYVWNFTDFDSYTTRPYTVNGRFTGISGDFTGDGTDDIIWYVPGSGQDYIWDYNSDGNYTSVPYTINGSYTPVAGSFGTNETDDVLWYVPGSGADYLWDFNVGSTTYASRPFPINGSFRPIVFDLWNEGWTGDDIFWYSPGAGADYVWDFLGGSYVSNPDPVNGNYYSVVAGDYFADGHDDIYWFGFTGETLWDHAPNEEGGVTRWNYTAVYGAASATHAEVLSAGGAEGVSPSGSVEIERNR
jgi:hypothetical protein